MKTKTLLQKINMLPLLEKKEVDDFVDFLLFKKKIKKEETKKTRVFGVFKNKIKIAPDFEEPLEDFNNYQ